MLLKLGGTVLGMALIVSACGGEEGQLGPTSSDVSGPLAVHAEPEGGDFVDGTTVELKSNAPARVLFTTDGSEPNEQHGTLYTQPIHLDSSTLLSFIAISDADVWSPPAAELYMISPTPAALQLPPREISVDRDAIFFAVRGGDTEQQHQTIRITSIGTDPVTIREVKLDANPKGVAFWEDGVFSIESTFQPIRLEHGRSIEVDIGYTPRSTLRSAALVIVSDEQQAGGTTLVELWGRVFNW